jgi:uncharacterized protein YyaL (SSP411 family)
MKEFIKFAEIMCDFIMKNIPNQHGFFRTEPYNVETLEWTSEKCDPDDVGDFAPFMAWYDKITGGMENIEWVEKQVRMLNSKMMQHSGFYHPFSINGVGLKKLRIFPSYPQNHADTLIGMNMLYQLTGNKLFFESARKLCNAIMNYAVSGKGFVYGSVIPALHLYYPKFGFLRHKPQISGVFIEELSNFYRITGNKELLLVAEKMANAWLSTKTFKKYGVCAEQVYPFIGKEAVNRAKIAKENTNFLYGLIRLLEVSENAELERSVKIGLAGLSRYLDKRGAFGMFIDTKSGKVRDSCPCMCANHMAIGVFIDAHIVLGEKEYLEIAEKCADLWVGLQLRNGLYPTFLDKRPECNICEIDPHLDFVTALCKLYLLVKRGKYKKSIKSGALAAGHFVRNGMIYNKVDFISGKPVDKMNELKFLGGALKGLMSAYTVLNDVQKVDKELLRMLMRDR